jgi:hypothetical protein
MTSTQWVAKTANLLNDEALASVLVRLMIVMNDISVTNSQMVEWQMTEDPKKKPRWRGAVLYFGRIQSAHLLEALKIIREIDQSTAVKARVGQCSKAVNRCFDIVATFLDTADHKMLDMLRSNIAFHYSSKLPIRRLKRLVEVQPDHRFSYSMGNETLDWYFELGDLIADEVVVRDIFKIDEKEDIATAAIKVLDRLHVIGDAFTRFAAYFVRECCKK